MKLGIFHRWLSSILISIKSIKVCSISFVTPPGRSSNIIYEWTLTSFANYSQMEICNTKTFPSGLRDSLHVLKVDDGKALSLWLHGAHFLSRYAVPFQFPLSPLFIVCKHRNVRNWAMIVRCNHLTACNLVCVAHRAIRPGFGFLAPHFHLLPCTRNQGRCGRHITSLIRHWFIHDEWCFHSAPRF